jgi:hypothetical protein
LSERSLPTFQRSVLPPSSGRSLQPRRQPSSNSPPWERQIPLRLLYQLRRRMTYGDTTYILKELTKATTNLSEGNRWAPGIWTGYIPTRPPSQTLSLRTDSVRLSANRLITFGGCREVGGREKKIEGIVPQRRISKLADIHENKLFCLFGSKKCQLIVFTRQNVAVCIPV